MKTRPILFSGSMVRALLAGTKTQTRRVVKVPPAVQKRGPILDRWPLSNRYTKGSGQYPGGNPNFTGDQPPGLLITCADGTCQRVPCPYGIPGDRLRVRESWRTAPYLDMTKPRDMKRDDLGRHPNICFEADAAKPQGWGKCRPGIFLPTWASRITLEITAVRVERAQAISEADAKAEGIRELPDQEDQPGAWWTGDVSKGTDLHARSPAAAFRRLWCAINGAESWAANPWVWVLEFKVVSHG